MEVFRSINRKAENLTTDDTEILHRSHRGNYNVKIRIFIFLNLQFFSVLRDYFCVLCG